MQGELVRFKTRDGLNLQGLLFEPKAKTSKVLVHVHGWVGNFYENLFIDPISESVLEKNIAFLSFNNRGAGIVTEFLRTNKRENIGGSLEIFEECLLDIEGALNFLQKRGYTEMILQGHSLGCQKIIYYQHNKKDKRVKGLILIAPVNDAEFVSKKLFNKSKYENSLKIAKDMIQEGKAQDPVPKWMQYYPMLSANMFLQVSDPNSISGQILDYSRKLTELKDIRVPILAIFGSKDDFQIQPADKLHIIQNVTGCDILLIKNSNHLFSSCEMKLAENISKWILRKT